MHGPLNSYKKLTVSEERERLVGKEGLREMGVFLRESLINASLMVVNGNLIFGSGCMQSSSRSCNNKKKQSVNYEYCTTLIGKDH